jgi:hypothetical protein
MQYEISIGKVNHPPLLHLYQRKFDFYSFGHDGVAGPERHRRRTHGVGGAPPRTTVAKEPAGHGPAGLRGGAVRQQHNDQVPFSLPPTGFVVFSLSEHHKQDSSCTYFAFFN